MTPYTGGQDIDPRAHKSFIMPGFELENLGVTRPEQRRAYLALLWEADEFHDHELAKACYRNMAVQASHGGGRVQVMKEVAIHDGDLAPRVEREDEVRRPVV